MCGGWMNIFRRAGVVVQNNGKQLKAFSALAETHKNMVEAKTFIANAAEIDKGAAPTLVWQEKRIAKSEKTVRDEANNVTDSIPDADYKAMRLAANLPVWAPLYAGLGAMSGGLGAMAISLLADMKGFVAVAEYDAKKGAQLIGIAIGLVIVSKIAREIRKRTVVGKAADSAEEAREIAKGEPIVEDDEE